LSFTRSPPHTAETESPTLELAPTADHSTPIAGNTSALPSVAPASGLTPIVIRFGRVGDMIMLTSILRVLHLRYRERCIVLGAGSWNGTVYGDHPDIAAVWSFPRHWPLIFSLTWLRVVWLLHRTAPAPIYVCERHPRQLRRVRRFLALSGVDPRRCLFITDSFANSELHWVDRFVQFGQLTPSALRARDYSTAGTARVRAPQLLVSSLERAERDAWLHARGWHGRKLILIQPGNHRTMSRRRERWRRRDADDKAWPLECWVDLLKKIHERLPEAVVALCGAPQEESMLAEIRDAAAMAEVCVASMPLRQLFALCESAHSMISVDTGPAHAAAALGLPAVVMYGAEAQRFWLPRSPSGSPVLGVGGPPYSVRVDRIPVDDVFQTWCALLARM
jgi:heptosyltransferase-2/heptosyltransferase-3